MPLFHEFSDAAHWLSWHRLPARWAGRDNFVVLTSAADWAERFAAVWERWRRDDARCARLQVIAPASQASVESLRLAACDGTARVLADALPPATSGLHRLSFEEGRLQLSLFVGAPADWLREIVGRADALALTSADLRLIEGGWNLRRIKASARLAAADATLSVEVEPGDASPAALADALIASGFRLEAHARRSAAGAVLAATFSGLARTEGPRSRPRTGSAERRAIVVGAGLAGCAAVRALAEHGWRTTLIDRQPTVAAEASGNPGGVFHGVFHPGDGVHARLHRAAALEAERAVRHAIEVDGVAGAVCGLLRLETALSIERMRALLRESGLPASYLQAASREEARALCAIPLPSPAWFYPGGGWVDPAGLARSFLRSAGDRMSFLPSARVARLVDATAGSGESPRWRALDEEGRMLAEADAVVLANGGDALALAGWPWLGIAREARACRPVRGQLSTLGDSTPGLPLVRRPVAGAGYLLPPSAGHVVFGATAQEDDEGTDLRLHDHRLNLLQLERLTGARIAVVAADCGGRSAIRWVTDDRLPLIGGVPAADGGRAPRARDRLAQPRWVPRVAGLYLYTALGSRGIGWSTLGAQILASWVSGAPSPVAASLLDAVDPARLVARAARRAPVLAKAAAAAD